MRGLGTYADWKHCITVLCGIPLTRDFVERRLSALRDADGYETLRFVQTWGEAHRQRTIGWFEQARRELNP